MALAKVSSTLSVSTFSHIQSVVRIIHPQILQALSAHLVRFDDGLFFTGSALLAL